MYNSVVGLVFFSTPFRGTHESFSMGKMLDYAEKMHQKVYRQNYQISREGDDTLLDVVSDFLRISRDNVKPRILCFYERKETDISRLLSRGKEENKSSDEVRYLPHRLLPPAHIGSGSQRTRGTLCSPCLSPFRLS